MDGTLLREESVFSWWDERAREAVSGPSQRGYVVNDAPKSCKHKRELVVMVKHV